MDREPQQTDAWQTSPQPIDWRRGFRTYALAGAESNPPEDLERLRADRYTDEHIAKLEQVAATIAQAVRETQEMLPADASNAMREQCFLMVLGMPLALAGHFLSGTHPRGVICPNCIQRWMQQCANAMSHGWVQANELREQADRAVN